MGSCCRAHSLVAMSHPCETFANLHFLYFISLLSLPATVTIRPGVSLCLLFRTNCSIYREKKKTQTHFCFLSRAASLATSPSWTPFPLASGSSCCSPTWPSAASSSWLLGNVAATAFPFLAVPSSVTLPAPWRGAARGHVPKATSSGDTEIGAGWSQLLAGDGDFAGRASPGGSAGWPRAWLGWGAQERAWPPWCQKLPGKSGKGIGIRAGAVKMVLLAVGSRMAREKPSGVSRPRWADASECVERS